MFVSDKEMPTLGNPPKNIHACTNIGKAFAIVNWTEPGATDNSDDVTLSSTRNPGAKFYIGTTNVTYTAIDPSGNKAYFTFMVTVTGELIELFLKIMYVIK